MRSYHSGFVFLVKEEGVLSAVYLYADAYGFVHTMDYVCHAKINEEGDSYLTAYQAARREGAQGRG